MITSDPSCLGRAPRARPIPGSQATCHNDAVHPWRLPLLVALLLLVLRSAQLACMASQLYLGEYAIMGSLLWDLQTGSFAFRGVRWLLADYSYFGFAQGTVPVQLLTAALGSVLPRTWALHAPSMLAEAATVAVLARLLLSQTRGAVAGLAVAATILVPATVVSWQLMPFGNHTEWLWVPAGLALFLGTGDPAQRRTRDWLIPVALLGLGIAMYRYHLLIAVVFGLACVLGRQRRVAIRGVAAACGGLVLAWALTALAGPHATGSETGNPLESIVGYLRTMKSMISAPLGDGLRNGIFGAPQQEGLLGLPYRVVLVAAVVGALVLAWRRRAAGEPQAALSLFAAGWAVAGLAVPLVLAGGAERYFIPGLYGALLCAGLVAGAAQGRRSRLWALGLAALCMGGAVDNARFIQPAGIALTRQLDAVALYRGLGVWWLDVDELPYWNRLLDEGRANPFAGSLSRDFRGVRCPGEPFGFEAPGRVPDALAVTCSGFERAELTPVVDSVLGEGAAEGWTEAQLLDALGRGAWIRNDRDLDSLPAAFDGVPADRLALILAAAADEASRW